MAFPSRGTGRERTVVAPKTAPTIVFASGASDVLHAYSGERRYFVIDEPDDGENATLTSRRKHLLIRQRLLAIVKDEVAHLEARAALSARLEAARRAIPSLPPFVSNAALQG